jgi:hypothetical protein
MEAKGQNCFEIKSILVDACGTPEGENEMVRLDVGATAIAVSNLSVDWPNNIFLNFCQSSVTAQLTATLNSSIQGCGLLLEPTNGVIPPYTKLLIFTSTNVSTTANSFANLNDTLIVLYQCAGNTAGHFANYNTSPGLRTLSISINNNACTDSVTYDRNLLVDQNGGQSGLYDFNGSSVLFDDSGVATYVNYGCQALGAGNGAFAGNDTTVCVGTAITVNGNAAGTSLNVLWSGGTGTFANATTAQTIYTPGANDTGLVFLTFTSYGICNTSVSDTIIIDYTFLPAPIISQNGNYILSNVINAAYVYSWTINSNIIPNADSTAVFAAMPGCYQLTITNSQGCSNTSNLLCITNVNEINQNNDYSFLTVGHNLYLLHCLNADSKEQTASILDIAGRRVKSLKLTNHNSLNIDVSTFAKGIYFLTIPEQNNLKQFKIVKQ